VSNPSHATIELPGGRSAPLRRILGVPVAAVTLADALEIVDDAIRSRRRLQIGVVNAAKVVNMRRDPVLREDVLRSDVIFADGIAVVWAGKVLGEPLPERVAGIDLMMGILDRGGARGYRVFFLGATKPVLDKVVARANADFPGLVVAGSQDGYFAPDAAEKVAGAISASRADVLFVAMTSPKKEQFLARWSESMGVPVCHGVGGSFDVYSGLVQRAPRIWQRLGLEWLYRVKQEPGRLWRRYLVTNALFGKLLVVALLRRAVGRKAVQG
jgi:N-acetylglucosaminyldiphosphoundecaprenol N-acetyl-beta-D-mannosaminyltransferase